MRYAYFAAGCFWCIVPVFRNTPGVLACVSGYSGGAEESPRYEDVKNQKTGHRETVQVSYDERVTDWGTLFDLFLENVDPFDAEGQFIDRGRSYTLAVYYLEKAEKEYAEKALRDLEEKSGQKPAIAIEPFRSFFMAEEYHQDYDLKNPEAFQKELEESGRLSRERGKSARKEGKNE